MSASSVSISCSNNSSSSQSTNNNGDSGVGKNKGEVEDEVLFRKGSRVEVCTNDPGLSGVWFVGTIVQDPQEEIISKNNRKRKKKELVVMVEYDTLLVDEESKKPLREKVGLSFVRPIPPDDDGGGGIIEFEKGDLVDAFHRDGWWVGVIINSTRREIDEDEDEDNDSSKFNNNKNNKNYDYEYEVFFKDPPEFLTIHHSLLRHHLEWVQGKWIRPKPQPQSQHLDMRKQKVGGLETGRAKEIRSKMRAEKSKVGKSGGASSTSGKKSDNASAEGSDMDMLIKNMLIKDMLIKDIRDSRNKEKDNEPKGVEGNQKRKRRRPPLKRPDVSAKRAVASGVIDASTGEDASKTNSKAQVDGAGEMQTDVLVDLTPLPELEEGMSSHTVMNDLRVTASSAGTINQCASDIQKENDAAALPTPTNASKNISNEEVGAGVIVDKNNSQSQSWPFVKCSALWPAIESSPIFQKTARTLHFSSLDKEDNEEFREGLAIGYTVTFATTLERISKLQFSDPISIIERYLGTLAELEKHGFDVEPARVFLHVLLSKKAKESHLQDESKELDCRIAQCELENKQLEDKQSQIEAKLRELQQEHQANALKKELKDQEMATLKSNKELINEQISTVNLDFQRIVSAPPL
ncbi:hypothetical protein LguiA_004859 [Lonicera macranthoides]